MNTDRMNARKLGFVVALAALILDQGCKQAFLHLFGFAAMVPGDAIPVLPVFNLVMVWNPGITFGLFPADSMAGTVFLATFQFLAIGALSWWLWTTKSRFLTVSLGLIVGGAIGNLIDRLVYGKVADFFHFYVGRFDWYVFNVADAAITIGVLGLLYDALSNSNSTENLGGKADKE